MPRRDTAAPIMSHSRIVLSMPTDVADHAASGPGRHLAQDGRGRCAIVVPMFREWFDSGRADETGTAPDYRFSLANERTFLAWIRTGLSLIAGGLAVAAFVPPLRVSHLREALAVVLLLLGALVSLRAVDHWARCERAMRHGRPLPVSRFPAVLAIVIGAGAVALTVAVIARGLSR